MLKPNPDDTSLRKENHFHINIRPKLFAPTRAYRSQRSRYETSCKKDERSSFCRMAPFVHFLYNIVVEIGQVAQHQSRPLTSELNFGYDDEFFFRSQQRFIGVEILPYCTLEWLHYCLRNPRQDCVQTRSCCTILDKVLRLGAL